MHSKRDTTLHQIRQHIYHKKPAEKKILVAILWTYLKNLIFNQVFDHHRENFLMSEQYHFSSNQVDFNLSHFFERPARGTYTVSAIEALYDSFMSSVSWMKKNTNQDSKPYTKGSWSW